MKYILLAACLLAGCTTSLPANPTKMSPEQLKEWVKDKNANITCGYTNNPYGKFAVNMIVLDKGLLPNGTVVVDTECKITITNTLPPPKEKP